MNDRLVFLCVGVLLLLLAMGACLILGYVLPPGSGHSGEKALNGWEISMAITGISGGLLVLFGKRERTKPLLRRDAIGIVGIGGSVCSGFASLPHVICQPELPLVDAFFEAVSGLTTTGATVFADLSRVPETVLLWRLVTQWLGRMEILRRLEYITILVLFSTTLWRKY